MADINKALQQFSREEEEQVTEALAAKHKLPYVNLIEYQPAPDVIQIISEEDAKKYYVVPYLRVGTKIKVASPNPDNPNLVPYLRRIADATNRSIVLAVCSVTSYRYMVTQYQFVKDAPETLEHLNIENPLQQSDNPLKTFAQVRDLLARASVTKLSEILFSGALALDASDVHLEPRDTDFRVRYRIDGVLQDVVALPKESYKPLRDRIKYLSQLKLDTVNTPQDGRFDIRAFGRSLDIRVSALPGAFGEIIVMRILDPQGKLLTLDELGFRQDAQQIIEEAVSKPNGVILNTGPTGSGKTTTLYALIQKLNKTDIKIVTLEDPIEYRIPGVDQSQVHPTKGYTFASGLRSVLRQDPDIIMVGEIRDRETAATALQAALTGHLVLSTLHTNSAPSALPRLLEMQIEPFLISGSINLIIAQRLVRRLCPECKGKKMVNGVECSKCSGTGYKGRVAIVETMKITPKIEELIMKRASVADFERMARAEGMITMYEDGIAKVKAGITSKEEVLRVSQESVEETSQKVNTEPEQTNTKPE